MVNKAQARVRLGVDRDQLNKGLKDAAKDVGDWGVRINQSLEVAKKAWGFVSDAVGYAIGVAREWTKIAEEQVGAEKKLESALRLRGEFTYQALAAQKAFGTEIQTTTTYGDEWVLGLQAQAVALGVHEKDLQRATRATIGFMQAGLGQSAALKAVNQLLKGEMPQGLKRWGLAQKDANATLEYAISLFRLAEDAADTFTGRSTQLTNAVGDFKETAALAVVEAKAIQDILKILTRTVVDLTTRVGEAGLTGTLDELAVQAAHFTADAIDGFAELIDRVNRLDVAAKANALWQLSAILPPMYIVHGLISEIERNFRSMAEVADAAWNFSKLLPPMYIVHGLVSEFERMSNAAGPESPTVKFLKETASALREVEKAGGFTPLDPTFGTGERLFRDLRAGGSGPQKKAKKGKEPTGSIGRSKLTETFSAPELGIFDAEVLKAANDVFKEFDDERFQLFVDSQKRLASAQDEKMRQMREIADEENRIRKENLELARDYHINLQHLEAANTDIEVRQLVESAQKRREIFDITLSLIQTSAELTASAVRAGIDALVEAAVTGQKFSSKAFASIIADMMIQQGWAFQSQAIAYTFEAIANYGSTAWRAAAMGSAAKTMLIAGYALKAKVGGGGGSAPSIGAGASSGGGGRGSGPGVGGLPSATRPTGGGPQQATPAIVYNINIGIAGGDGRKVAQDIRRVLREGGATQPTRRRA